MGQANARAEAFTKSVRHGDRRRHHAWGLGRFLDWKSDRRKQEEGHGTKQVTAWVKDPPYIAWALNPQSVIRNHVTPDSDPGPQSAGAGRRIASVPLHWGFSPVSFLTCSSAFSSVGM